MVNVPRKKHSNSGISDIDDDKIPPADDPRWVRWCIPLLGYIEQESRSKKDLITWGKYQKHELSGRNGLNQHIVINMLAWLSTRGLVGCKDGAWFLLTSLYRKTPIARLRTTRKDPKTAKEAAQIRAGREFRLVLDPSRCERSRAVVASHR